MLLVLLLMTGVVLAVGEQLENPVVSSGGNVPPTNAAGLQIHTIIGQPVIGVSSGAGLQAELGALYGFGLMLVEEEGVPAGTVPLFITRNGTTIEVTWEAQYLNPQIFVLTGEGTGSFANSATGWILVAQNGAVVSPLPAGVGSLILASTTLTHSGQVGGGIAEVYYKGLQAGVTPTATHPGETISYLSSAPAVGKVNVGLGQNKYQLVNIPLDLGGKTFGSEIAVLMPNGTLQYKDSSGILKQAAFIAGVSDSPNELIILSNGFWFKSNDARTVSFVGRVKSDQFSRALGNRYNLFGFPFPRLVNVNAGELGIAPVSGDTMQSQNDSGILLQYSYNGSIWDDPNLKLKAPRGFWYFNSTTNPRTFSAEP